MSSGSYCGTQAQETKVFTIVKGTQYLDHPMGHSHTQYFITRVVWARVQGQPKVPQKLKTHSGWALTEVLLLQTSVDVTQQICATPWLVLSGAHGPLGPISSPDN